jgi:hypothetical protein
MNHSCESAFHEIISQINNIKNKRLIGLFFFIDFKKAFETVDARLFPLAKAMHPLVKYSNAFLLHILEKNYFEF